MPISTGSDPATPAHLRVRLRTYGPDDGYHTPLPLDLLGDLIRGIGDICIAADPRGEPWSPYLRETRPGSLELVIDFISVGSSMISAASDADEAMRAAADAWSIINSIASTFAAVVAASVAIKAYHPYRARAPRKQSDDDVAVKDPSEGLSYEEFEAEIIASEMKRSPRVRRGLQALRLPLSHLQIDDEPAMIVTVGDTDFAIHADDIDAILSLSPRPSYQPTEQLLFEVVGVIKAVNSEGSHYVLEGLLRSGELARFHVRDGLLARRLDAQNSSGLVTGYMLAEVQPNHERHQRFDSSGARWVPGYDLLQLLEQISFAGFGTAAPEEPGPSDFA